MTYKESIIKEMDILAEDRSTVFIGYGISKGKAMGTLKNVPESQLIETPVAENLMMGLAIGFSLRGKKPVVFVERCDFILNALDAIVNHLDKINSMSEGEFSPAVIIRVVTGNKFKPLFTGETHTQDFTEALRDMLSFPVLRINDAGGECYKLAKRRIDRGESTILIENKDLL